MNVYAVTMTLEFQVLASSRKQAEKFARQSIEDRCITLEDADMTVAKVQFVGGSPSAQIDGGERD